MFQVFIIFDPLGCSITIKESYTLDDRLIQMIRKFHSKIPQLFNVFVEIRH